MCVILSPMPNDTNAFLLHFLDLVVCIAASNVAMVKLEKMVEMHKKFLDAEINVMVMDIQP
jgi:hypothetical protein